MSRSAEELKKLLEGEIANAKQEVNTARVTAEERFRKLNQNYQIFVKETQAIAKLLQPRIAAFEAAFPNLKKNVTILELGPAGKDVHGAFVTFTIDRSEICPANIKLRYSLEHDQSIDHILLTYRLDIIPVFMEFTNEDRLVLPIDSVDLDRVAEWFDDRAIQFTRTIVKMFFTPQYQDSVDVPDIVLGMNFPRAFAAGEVEHDGHTYYFFSNEAKELFVSDPAKYVARGD